MKTIRQYAEQIKQASGTVLGIFEMSQGLPTGSDPKVWITNYVNALPNGVLSQFSFFPTTADIAAFVIAAGPVIEQVAPVA